MVGWWFARERFRCYLGSQGYPWIFKIPKYLDAIWGTQFGYLRSFHCNWVFFFLSAYPFSFRKKEKEQEKQQEKEKEVEVHVGREREREARLLCSDDDGTGFFGDES